MKKSIYILIALIVYYGCASDKNIKTEISDSIDLTIEQSGNIINITDDTAEIRRTKFTIKFKFPQPESVLVNASFKSETFNNAGEGLPLSDLSGFRNTGIAEDLFNRESVIYLSKNSPNFWYYADDADHRFNSVLKNESGYLCSRDISGIVDHDGTGEKIDLIKIRENTIYIVIIKIEWNDSYTRMIEKSRKLIKLKFVI
jgi:hypothetical protein